MLSNLSLFAFGSAFLLILALPENSVQQATFPLARHVSTAIDTGI